MRARSRYRRLRFETLECRWVLAEVTWVGGVTDSWHDASNWSTGNVPIDGDVAIFNNAAGSSVTLYSDQTNRVALVSIAGQTAINLQGFDFRHYGIDARAAALTISGPGRVLDTWQAGDVLVGGSGVLASAYFIDLDDLSFQQLKVGGSPLFNENFEIIAHGSGFAEIRNSTSHGEDILIGMGSDGSSELRLTEESDVTLNLDFVVANQSVGTASVLDSTLIADFVLVGDGVDFEGNPLEDPQFQGTMTVSRSNVTTQSFEVAFIAAGEVTIDQGSNFTVVHDAEIGMESDGTVTIKDDATEFHSRKLWLGIEDGSVGRMTVKDGASVDAWKVEIGSEEDAQGELVVDSGGTVVIERTAIVANSGTGALTVDGSNSSVNAGSVTIGLSEGSSGVLVVKNQSHIIVTDANRPVVPALLPDMTVGDLGTGRLDVIGQSRVDIRRDLRVGIEAEGNAHIIVNGSSNVIAEGNVQQFLGKLLELKVDLTSKVQGQNGPLAQMAAATIEVKGDSILEGTDGLEIGGGPNADVAVFSGGRLLSNVTVQLNANTLLRGDSLVEAGVSTLTTSTSAVVNPQTEAGGIATFTFATPEFNVSAGVRFVIDAPSIASNDHIHASGAVALGGVVEAIVGFDPVPWRLDGTGGDYIHVLSCVDALTGTMMKNLPPVESFDLPPPEPGAHYEWKIIYDRNDATPDGALMNQSQPWVGNGTHDVVLVIREVPPFDPYETYGEGVFDIDENGTTITLGDDTRGELDSQPAGFHGGSICLAPAAEYVITVSYNLATWDSYNEDTGPGTGYWDSFSISVTDEPFYSLSLEDPLPFPFVWGGSIWGDAVLDTTAGTITLTIPGNAEEPSYLNLVLDTLTPPTMDELYPSWGTFTITTPLDTCTGGESLLGGGGGGSLMGSSSGGFFGLEGGSSIRGGGGMLLLAPSSPESGAEGEILPPLAPLMGSGLAGAGLPGAGHAPTVGEAIAAGLPLADDSQAPPLEDAASANRLSSVDFLFSRARAARSPAALRTLLPAVVAPRPTVVGAIAAGLLAGDMLIASDSAVTAEDAPDDLEWLFAGDALLD